MKYVIRNTARKAAWFMLRANGDLATSATRKQATRFVTLQNCQAFIAEWYLGACSEVVCLQCGQEFKTKRFTGGVL